MYRWPTMFKVFNILTKLTVKVRIYSRVTFPICRFSTNLAVHFAEGLTEVNFERLDFTLPDGRKYHVSAAIEYKSSPNHFTVWQRHLTNKEQSCELMQNNHPLPRVSRQRNLIREQCFTRCDPSIFINILLDVGQERRFTVRSIDDCGYMVVSPCFR
jgi:hypothetical protein